jgi:UDP-N-acetylmuramoylalanine--D-glutamate ligase
MNALAGITVLVLGLGESGLAMARWCARCGATVRAWDTRLTRDETGRVDTSTLASAALLQSELPAVQLIAGPLDEGALDGVQRLLKSPGLAPTDARIAGTLALAAQRGLPVQGELDLFAAALADLRADRAYAPQVIAITGTNGKTTTTAMCALFVERAGRRVAVAGNIGPTLLGTLGAALDNEAAEPLPEVWVLELSSFQLDGVSGFEPDAAAILNLTEDHLDWHGSMASYGAAKARIWGREALMVVNRNDAQVEALAAAADALATVPANKSAAAARAARRAARSVLRFGTDAPREPGDYGLITDGAMAWLVRAMESEDGAPRRRSRGDDAAEPEPLLLQRLMPADALRLRGRHNAANALAALALAGAIGCPLAPMLHGLREYTGEPHRLQFVAGIDGVDGFDDSKGTNVGATVAAIEGLAADRAPSRLVLILGGDGKGQDFSPLAAPLQRHARAIATLGRDAALIEQALAGQVDVPVQRHATLEAATRWAFGQAKVGDAVLLSPACASLDMFRNYAHRGDVFAAAVFGLAGDMGMPA